MDEWVRVLLVATTVGAVVLGVPALKDRPLSSLKIGSEILISPAVQVDDGAPSRTIRRVGGKVPNPAEDTLCTLAFHFPQKPTGKHASVKLTDLQITYGLNVPRVNVTVLNLVGEDGVNGKIMCGTPATIPLQSQMTLDTFEKASGGLAQFGEIALTVPEPGDPNTLWTSATLSDGIVVKWNSTIPARAKDQDGIYRWAIQDHGFVDEPNLEKPLCILQARTDIRVKIEGHEFRLSGALADYAKLGSSEIELQRSRIVFKEAGKLFWIACSHDRGHPPSYHEVQDITEKVAEWILAPNPQK